MKGLYECMCQSGTGKTVLIRVEAISYSQAHHKVRKQMAMNFKGKTYTVQRPVKFIEPVH